MKSVPTVGIILAADAMTRSLVILSSCLLLSQEVVILLGLLIQHKTTTTANIFCTFFHVSDFFYFKCFDFVRDCFTKTLFLKISNRVHKEIASCDH